MPKMTKTQKGKAGRPAGSGVKGHVPVLLQLLPTQKAALWREAVRRAEAAGGGRPDVSELVREAIDAWLKRRS